MIERPNSRVGAQIVLTVHRAWRRTRLFRSQEQAALPRPPAPRRLALLAAGWPAHYVQHMLGHASLQQTSTYLNATLRGLRESMRNLD